MSRPHLDMMYNLVDEVGADAATGAELWFGEVPGGPDGEPLVCNVPEPDKVLRDLRAASIIGE